jgi:hypothetical protein
VADRSTRPLDVIETPVIVEVLVVIFIGIAVLNVWATWKVLRDEMSSPVQRFGQTLVVWFVPLLGAALTLYLKRQNPEPGTGTYREIPDAGDDFGYSGRARREVVETLNAAGDGDPPAHD